MGGSFYVGTSGFAYEEWRGSFYPEGMKAAEMLDAYSARLPSVEINYTFRRYPSEKTVAGWVARTGEEFRFALKANQRITHTLRLASSDEAVGAFLERARGLGERLGVILFQCPPSLAYDQRLIAAFLGYLPPTFRYAFEFRHPSWREARDVIAEQGAAWCDAETDETPVSEITPGPFAYLRLRKDDYSDEELSEWARRIRGALKGGRDVFAFFKHESAAPAYAERLTRLVTA